MSPIGRIYLEKKFISQAWLELLGEEWLLKLHHNVAPKIHQLVKSGVHVFPNSPDILKALTGPLPRVMLLGKEPYNDGRGTGLAFDNYIQTQFRSPALRGIINKFQHDTGRKFIINPEQDTILEHWHRKGICLLNMSLTSEKEETLAHIDLWEPLTKEILFKVNTLDDIVWVILGKELTKYTNLITNPTHTIIKSTYPNQHGLSRFMNNNIFSHKIFNELCF